MPKKEKVIKTIEPRTVIPLYQVRFVLKAVIPTGTYGNIQPELTVSANTLEEAEAIVLPYFEKLNEKYLNWNEPKPKASVTKSVQVAVEQPVVTSSEAYTKAGTAIKTAYSKEALVLIRTQIEKSKRLNENEKAMLNVLLVTRGTELHEKQNSREEAQKSKESEGKKEGGEAVKGGN